MDCALSLHHNTQPTSQLWSPSLTTCTLLREFQTFLQQCRSIPGYLLYPKEMGSCWVIRNRQECSLLWVIRLTQELV